MMECTPAFCSKSTNKSDSYFSGKPTKLNSLTGFLVLRGRMSRYETDGRIVGVG